MADKTSDDLYRQSIESYTRNEEAYLKTLADSTTANLRAAIALERIADFMDWAKKDHEK